MKSILIDTNVLLRFLLNDIPAQKEESERLITSAKNNDIKLSIAQASIFEIDFVLRKYYKFEKKVIIEQLKPLLSAKYIIIESREIFNKALDLYKKENISFVDAFLFSKAWIEKSELFTFDQKLKKLQS